MRSLPYAVAGFAVLGGVALASSIVGSGAPSFLVQQSFIAAYNRGAFSTLTSIVLNDVHLLGTGPALVQELQAKSSALVKYSLIDPAPAGANVTFQVYGDIYAVYNATTDGYPTIDTTSCPTLTAGVCDYQLFSSNVARFAYSSPLATTYSVADPIYTEWIAAGGISGSLGPASSAASTVTSVSGTSGSQQLFAGGAVFAYPLAHAVSGAIYTAYAAYGGYAVLGFPTTEEIVLASGIHQQSFEAGHIQWTPGNPAVVLSSIAQIYIGNAFAGARINQGGTVTLSATAVDNLGNLAIGRTLTWSTSNGAVATVVGNGATAVVTGVGPGTANIYVSGEGKTSAPFVVTVTAQCCAIGDGAPTTAISQAFQNAASRNHLAVLLPNPTPVTSVGTGFVQILTAADGSGTVWAISWSSTSGSAYVIGGALYAAYLGNGGFTGPLGFPASDASAGTQVFVSGAALAGTPVLVVPAAIAPRWLASSLGAPTAVATNFVSLSGVTGISQAFASGVIFATTNAYAVSGLILTRYLALSGPSGALGAPVGEVQTNGGVLLQNFEFGYIDLQPGAAAAVEHFNARKPALSITPSSVAPGGRVHISATGFAPGASIGFTISGQPGFTVTPTGGQFAWDVVVPAGAAAAVVSVQAKATGSSDAASGAYTISSVAQLRPGLTVVSGDQQTGVPGAALTGPLVAVLRDANGNPMPGVPVTYSTSPGATGVLPAVTDTNGLISGTLRLPPAQGIAGLSVYAGGQVATFSALAAPSSIQNFPAASALNSDGTLVASLAAVIRFYQNAGQLQSPNGMATPSALAQFMTANGGGVNPWLATLFAGLPGGISVEAATLDHVRDVLNTATPVVLLFTAAGKTAAVDAIGVNGDGSIVTADSSGSLPSAVALTGVIRIVPTASTPIGFVFAGSNVSGLAAASPSGSCPVLDLSDTRFVACDGTASSYEISFTNQSGATITDLTGSPVAPIPANSGAAFEATRTSGVLTVTAQTISISSIVNSAGFGPGLSPGGIFTIFGKGLSGATVTVGGRTASILATFPYQVNAVMPGLAPGSAQLQVTSTIGVATQSVTIAGAAPGIFAVVNQDGSISSAVNPSQRGQYLSIYGTGLGATVAQAALQVVTAPVTVNLNGATLTPSWSGLTPGIAGLYQVNVLIPAGTAPGTATLSVQSGTATSNAVSVLIQ